MTDRIIPVLAAPLFDPGQGRKELALPTGLTGPTVAEIVAETLPGLPQTQWHTLRVTLVTSEGMSVVAQAYWHRLRPNPGVRVVIRAVPGKNALRSVLLAVVSVAATWLAPYLVGPLTSLGISSSLATSLVTAGLTIVGTLAINALIPPDMPDDDQAPNTYSIGGWRNQARPGQPVPLACGLMRYAPPFAATSYTEIIDGKQYVRALFTFGYGPVKIDDPRLGDTPITELDEVQIETREGRVGDAPVTLYPRQVLEAVENVELVRPLPRDDAGEIISGDSIETPVIRFTASDAQQTSVIFAFPAGLFKINDKGKVKTATVKVDIHQRPEGGTTWELVASLDFSAKQRDAFFRQHTWTLPSRGRWELKVTRVTDESTKTEVSDRVSLAAVQSIRPEYPLNLDKPLSLVAMRIRATQQLSGTLDSFNAKIQRYGEMWDGASWSEGLSRNPATAFLAALTGPANPFPVAAAEIDWDGLARWYDWCALKGLKYDRVHDRAQSLGEMLRMICGAGRATPRHDGIKWGVVVDRPDLPIIAHINPRNSAEFNWSHSYFDPPDGLRITFLDETNNYEPAERIVPWPGFTGEVKLTETLELPGKTNPDEIWIAARRRMYELIHRPTTYTAIQDGTRIATRGDLIKLSHDVLDRRQNSARVKSLRGPFIELDGLVTMEAGTDYVLEFKQYPDPEDVVGVSSVVAVLTAPGETSLLECADDAVMPEPGDLVHFGIAGKQSLALRVKGIEPGQDFASVLSLVADAPEIDALVEAEVPPAWNGRVGAEVAQASAVPGVPRIALISSGVTGTGDPDGLQVLLAADGASAVTTAQFQVQHRLDGASIWATRVVPAASASADLTGYSAGDAVEMQVIALAADGTASAPSTPVTHTIGVNDPPVPGALGAGSITVIGGLGHAAISLATGADPDLDRVQVYRVPAGDTLDRDAHAAGTPFAAVPSTTLGYIDGDGTRANLLADAGFDSPPAWTSDANWAVAGGAATHSTGVADTIRQPLTLTAGATYRGALEVFGLTAGSLTPTLFGGTDQADAAISTDGTAYVSIDAASGNTDYGVAATSDCDALIDNAVLFQVTAGCAPGGDFDYYLEPQNSEGGPGPVSGPFNTRVI